MCATLSMIRQEVRKKKGNNMFSLQKTKIVKYTSIKDLALQLYASGRIDLEKGIFNAKESLIFYDFGSVKPEDGIYTKADIVDIIGNYAYQQVCTKDDEELFDASTFVFECIAALCVLDGTIKIEK